MGTVGRLKEGDLLLTGEVNERLPAVTNGLVAHFPFDGNGGAWDIVGGKQASHAIESGANLVEGMAAHWRNPSSWSSNANMEWSEQHEALKVSGYRNSWLNTPIVIDASKTYELMYEVMIETRPSGAVLYLGGLSQNAAGAKATTNYDYTIASAATPTLGVWTTFKLTRTGTAVAGSGSSYSYDTVKGWDGGGAAADSLIKYYYMGGLFNYNGGGTMYIRNMSMRVVDDDTSNTTVTGEGVAVEESTTNLWNGGLTPYNNYGVPTTLVQLNETYLGEPVWRLGMTVTDPHADHLSHFRSSLSSHGIYGGSQSWVQDTPYASSIYWRPVNKPDTVFGGTASNTGGWSSGGNEQLENGWRRFYRYRTGSGVATKGDVVHHSFYCPSLQLNETIYIDFACPQTEQKLFPTSYTRASRGAPQLKITENVLNLSEGTMSCKFTPSKGFFTTNHWNRVFGHSTATNKNEIQVKRNSTGSNLVMSISNNAGTPQTSWSSCPSVNLVAGREYHVVARWSLSQGKMSLTVDGVKNEQSWTSGYLPTINGTMDIGMHSFTSRIANGRISNFSIYNKSLSDEEVGKLYGGKISMQGTGEIRTSVTEATIQPEGVYFSFGSDAKSHNGGIEPVVSDNEAYQDGALWVSRSTSNYAQYPCAVYASYYTYTREGDRHLAYRQEGSASPTLAMQCSSFSSALTAGTVYTISGYLYLNGKPFKTNVPNISTYHTETIRRRAESSGYFEYTQPFVSSGWVIHSNLCSAAIEDTIEIRNLQLEVNEVASAFTPTSRGDSEIVLPYNIIDCKQDFTITGWFFPKVFADGSYRPYLTRNRITSNATSERILIMGNGTTSRQLRCWFGSPAGGEASVYAPTSVNVVDNEWNFFCLRRSGNVVSLFAGVNGKIAYGTSGSGANLNTDQDAATWGWLVSKYNDAGHMGVGYAKDYNFMQRALSDAEVEAIYRTQMSASKEKGLLIQGQIKESEVL